MHKHRHLLRRLANKLHTPDKAGKATRGGMKAIALHFKTKPQNINSWRVDGIPHKHRPKFRALCEEHGVTVPEGFYG